MNDQTHETLMPIRDCIKELTDRLSLVPGDCIVFRKEREEAKDRHPSSAKHPPPSEPLEFNTS